MRDGHKNECKVCLAAKGRARYAANPGKYRERQQRWAKAHPEYIKQVNDYFNANRTDEQKIAYGVTAERWREENRERVREYARRARDRKRAHAVGSTWLPYREDEIFKRDDWTCQLCGGAIDMSINEPFHPDRRSIDHRIPLCAGGDDTPENVQAVHLWCNWSKSRGLVETFAPGA